KRHQKLASKKQPHPTNGKTRGAVKKQQTKTTKHTIEFSNNTPFSGNPTNLLSLGRAVKLLLWAFSAPLVLDVE
ncbi:hypothetical protein, partial [Mycobacterium sp. SMC-17]